jgi:hypothetical protein
MVFVLRKETKKPGFPVGVVLNRPETKGDIGIEIEVEGAHLPHVGLPMPWIAHTDGSLRIPKVPGGNAYEYVLQAPIPFGKVDKAVTDLYTFIAANKGKILESNRTSVHVHLNVQKFHFARLTAFMAIYFTLEELLTEWCGDHRVGNLFCLRAKDAPAIVSQIRKFIKTDGEVEIRDHHHYAALNANALHKFGSLEIRTLRGVADAQIIVDWVAMLRRIYDVSKEFPDPREVCGRFSGDGPLAFLDSILGEQAAILKKGVPYNEARVRDSLYDGIRMAQDLCYCRDWGIVSPVEVSPDPFGRDLRRLMKRIGGQLEAGTLPPLFTQAQGGIQWAMPVEVAEHDDLNEMDFGEDAEPEIAPIPAPQPTTAFDMFIAQQAQANIAAQQAAAQQQANAADPWWLTHTQTAAPTWTTDPFAPDQETLQ